MKRNVSIGLKQFLQALSDNKQMLINWIDRRYFERKNLQSLRLLNIHIRIEQQWNTTLTAEDIQL